MATRRALLAIVLLAAALHWLGIARSILPAQDGLKYLRVARAFQTKPWPDVVRGSDQHPLYPALVALAEPGLRVLIGPGPNTWRIAGQLVAAFASIAMLFPLHGITRRLFNTQVANLATLGCVLLPLPMAIGHDTLGDSLALLACVLSLRFGIEALDSGRWDAALGCGLAAGLGYLARPEVLVAPLAVVTTGISRSLIHSNGLAWPDLRPKLAGLSIAFLGLVGAYSLVKGEVSEKLALRQAALMSSQPKTVRSAGQWLPRGLDDPRWDFSPKEEPAVTVPRGVWPVLRELALQWADGISAVFAFFALWGVVRDGYIRGMMVGVGDEPPDPINLGRSVVGAYLMLFTLVLARHELRMGYLSDRHTLTLVILALPWAAAGVFVCARRLAAVLGLCRRPARLAGLLLFVLAFASGLHLQMKPAHASRWGHHAAGKWLVHNAEPGEAVLDTRGWATFVSGLPGYDYWHVKQAFTDSHLAYVVVGEDELNATSRRGETLRAVLAYAAKPVAAFPAKKGGHDVGVRVYRYTKPLSWEGVTQ